MFRTIRDTVGATPTDEALGACLDDLLDGKTGDRSGKLYGLGHAVYTMSDPRAIVIKKYAAALAREKGRLDDLELMERVEELGIQKIMARKHQKLPMCANVDLYSGLIYNMLDLPEDLYTPLFATARIAAGAPTGWKRSSPGTALCARAYRAAVEHRAYVPMEKRQ